MSLSDLTSDHIKNVLISKEISNGLADKIGKANSFSRTKAREKIDDFTRICWLLPTDVNELNTDVSGLDEVLREEDSHEILYRSGSSFKDHFAQIRSAYDTDRERFFNANIGLIGKHVNEELRRYDGLQQSLRGAAKHAGYIPLVESMMRFNHRIAINSEADRPFAAFAQKNIKHTVRTFLAKAVLGQNTPLVDDPPNPPVEDHKKGILTEIEIEVWEATANKLTYAQSGRDLCPKRTGRQVSRIRTNALDKMLYFSAMSNDPDAFIDSIPNTLQDGWCAVERIVLMSRYNEGKPFRAISKVLISLQRDIASLRNPYETLDGKCSKCKKHHSMPLTERMLKTILARVKWDLEMNGIEVPRLGQARGYR
jgi:hypothetical protein